MLCAVQWRDVLFVMGMHFSSKYARLRNFNLAIPGLFFFIFAFFLNCSL